MVALLRTYQQIPSWLSKELMMVMILEQAEMVERLRVEATDYGGLLLHGSGHTNSCGAVKQVCCIFKSIHKFPGRDEGKGTCCHSALQSLF